MMTTSRQPASSGRKRNSVAALLPPTIAWLEPLALTVHVDVETTTAVSANAHRHLRRKHATHYTLALQLKTASATEPCKWTLSRPFEDYRAFQKRLLKLIQLGHFCSAECPWLYTFVKSYFPKKTLFGTRTCARLAARRREALQRCFGALQTFLLNRSNHSCTIVVERVATELLAFVLQDAHEDHPLKARLSPEGWMTATDSTGRFSSDSVASTSDDDDSGSATPTGHESFVCALCVCSLESDPSSCSSYFGNDGEPATPEPSFTSASGASYTTTLSCGHEFHDECILSKLNESMQCPTCGTAQTCH